MNYKIEYPVFESEWEESRFINWCNGHLLFKDYLISVEDLNIRGYINRNLQKGDVKFSLILEYTNINTLDDVESIVETIEQR